MAHTLNAPNHAPPWSVALVGNPNCGKTALFNLLTGARQKVANYAGVTVERKVGTDPPGERPRGLGHRPARRLQPDAGHARRADHARGDRGPPRTARRRPTPIVAVVDATNLRMNLRLVLELKRLGRPLMVALNMADVARAARACDRRRQALAPSSAARWSRRWPCDSDGHAGAARRCSSAPGSAQTLPRADAPAVASLDAPLVGRAADAKCAASSPSPRPARSRCSASSTASTRVVMHPVWGLALLARRAVPDVPGRVLAGPTCRWTRSRPAMAGARRLDHCAHGRRAAAQPAGRRRDRRRRQRARLPAADPDPVLLHPRCSRIRATCRARPSCSTA